MRRGGALALLLLVALAGCGGTGSTATPDSATAAGYREELVARGQRIADAVVATNEACFARALVDCARTQAEQEARFQEEARWLRLTPAPQGCGELASGYRGVADAAEHFFALVGDAVAQEETGRVTSALGEGYPPFIRALDAANGALLGEACR